MDHHLHRFWLLPPRPWLYNLHLILFTLTEIKFFRSKCFQIWWSEKPEEESPFSFQAFIFIWNYFIHRNHCSWANWWYAINFIQNLTNTNASDSPWEMGCDHTLRSCWCSPHLISKTPKYWCSVFVARWTRSCGWSLASPNTAFSWIDTDYDSNCWTFRNIIELYWCGSFPSC